MAIRRPRMLGAIALLLALSWFLSAVHPPAALAASKTWTGAISTDWNNPDNWNPVGVPASGDDILIPAATSRHVSLATNATVQNLTVESGKNLTIQSGVALTVDGTAVAVTVGLAGTINGTGTLVTTGAVTLNNTGTLSAPLSVNSGVTAARGNSSGALVVASGATYQVQADQVATVSGAVTLNGSLAGTNNNSRVDFKGASFTNNGTVNIRRFDFTRSGNQTIAGAGSWTVTNSIPVGSSATVVLGNSLTLNVPTVTLNGGLNVGAHTLTLVGTTLNNNASITGTGTLRLEGTSQLNGGSYSPQVLVASGTTTGASWPSLTNANNALTVSAGATFQVAADQYVYTYGHVTVNGTLLGGNANS
jgi:hypothetical protein